MFFVVDCGRKHCGAGVCFRPLGYNAGGIRKEKIPWLLLFRVPLKGAKKICNVQKSKSVVTNTSVEVVLFDFMPLDRSYGGVSKDNSLLELKPSTGTC